MELENEVKDIFEVLKSLANDMGSPGDFSTSLLLYTMLQKPGTFAYRFIGTLSAEVRAHLTFEALSAARSIINPIQLEHIEYAAERIAQDLFSSKKIDSRHLLLVCLVGDAFIGPGKELGVPSTKTTHIIGWGNTAVRALRTCDVDVIHFLETLRNEPPKALPSFPSFYVFWPQKNRIRIFRIEDMGEFYHNPMVTSEQFFPTSLGFLDFSLGKGLDLVLEFEEMINDKSTPERLFQKFFEEHPEFLLTDEHIDVRPGFMLTRSDNIDLRPDFFLQRRDAPLWDIAELKLPTARLIRGRQGRIGLAGAVRSAMDQLNEYREYFFDSQLSKLVQKRHGIELFYPRLTLIIGRDESFGDYRIRQKHVPPELRLLTYDDLLRFAKHRSIVLPFDRRSL